MYLPFCSAFLLMEIFWAIVAHLPFSVTVCLYLAYLVVYASHAMEFILSVPNKMFLAVGTSSFLEAQPKFLFWLCYYYAHDMQRVCACSLQSWHLPRFLPAVWTTAGVGVCVVEAAVDALGRHCFLLTWGFTRAKPRCSRKNLLLVSFPVFQSLFILLHITKAHTSMILKKMTRGQQSCISCDLVQVVNPFLCLILVQNHLWFSVFSGAQDSIFVHGAHQDVRHFTTLEL